MANRNTPGFGFVELLRFLITFGLSGEYSVPFAGELRLSHETLVASNFLVPMKYLQFMTLIFLISCNQSTMKDELMRNVNSEMAGQITQIIKYKGNGYALAIDSYKFKQIAVAEQTALRCKLYDSFFKIKNSNKCILKRNDSIIYLDCLNLKEYKDSLPKIDEWKDKEKNIWMLQR